MKQRDTENNNNKKNLSHFRPEMQIEQANIWATFFRKQLQKLSG
jgi:hypothetical protein